MKGQIFEGDMYPVAVHWFRLPGVKILLAAPNVIEYGHIGLEFFYGLDKAHERGAPVFFIRPKKVVAESFFELMSDDVHIIEGTPIRQWFFNTCWAFFEAIEAWRVWKREFRDLVWKERRAAISVAIGRAPASPLTDKMRELRRQIATYEGYTGLDKYRPYYRRKNLARAFKLRFRARPLAEVQEAAARAGLTPDMKLVMLHVREPGWKRGREIQFLKPHKGRDDSVRNAHIESHLPALDYLVAQGYTIVRMGDRSMRPLKRPGVVDLASLEPPDPRLQLYCMMNARFMICGESGPLGFSCVTSTPSLSVNCTDPVSAFPIRGDSLYMLKTVIDGATGERLTMPQMLTERYLQHLRDTTRFKYIENTSDEILRAVKEMLTLLEQKPQESEAQRKYRLMATHAATVFRQEINYVRKWGADEGFLGEGRLVSFIAERDVRVTPPTPSPLPVDDLTMPPLAAQAADSR